MTFIPVLFLRSDSESLLGVLGMGGLNKNEKGKQKKVITQTVTHITLQWALNEGI